MQKCSAGDLCLQLPDYGLVTWDNAGDLMLKLDDPKDVSKKDLDRELCRTAQVGHFHSCITMTKPKYMCCKRTEMSFFSGDSDILSV